MIRVCEFRDVAFRDIDHLQDLVLGQSRLLVFRVSLLECLDLLSSWLVAMDLACLELSFKPVSRRLDGHASAVECKRKESVFANLSLEPRHELSLRNCVGVALRMVTSDRNLPRWR